MDTTVDINQLNPAQVHELAVRLLAENRFKQTVIDKLTHEMAILKRQKFAATSEAYSGEQQRELFDTINADMEALIAEMEQLVPDQAAAAEQANQLSNNQNVCGCRPNCRAQKFITNRIQRCAAVVAR